MWFKRKAPVIEVSPFGAQTLDALHKIQATMAQAAKDLVKPPRPDDTFLTESIELAKNAKDTAEISTQSRRYERPLELFITAYDAEEAARAQTWVLLRGARQNQVTQFPEWQTVLRFGPGELQSINCNGWGIMNESPAGTMRLELENPQNFRIRVEIRLLVKPEKDPWGSPG